MKKSVLLFFSPVVIFQLLCGFDFSHKEDKLPIRTCLSSKTDTLSFEDLLWMYQQQDTLPEWAVNQNLILGIKYSENKTEFKHFDQNHAPLDSLNKFDLYALRLIHQHGEIASFWQNTLKVDLDSFEIKKDSLTKLFPPKPYRLKFVSENRSLAKQIELHKKGSSKIMLSLHNFGLAADVGLYRYRKYLRRGKMYDKMGNKAKELGLFWGGDFVGFPDPGHIQAFSKSADLIQQYPILGFEFEKYKVQYENAFLKQKNLGREALVEDTKALLVQLNKLRMSQHCACSLAIMPPNDQETNEFVQQFLSKNQAVVYANLMENWVYIQKGQIGYFYSLGRWDFVKRTN